MKTVLLSAMLALTAQQMMADDYKYLTVYDKDGKATDISLKSLQKITFTGNDMKVLTDEGEQAFALTTLLKMAFNQTPTPVEAVEEATKGGLRFADGSLIVGGEAKGQTLCVYSQNGALVTSQKVGANGAAVNLTTLPKGVYVVRIGQTAIKIAK